MCISSSVKWLKFVIEFDMLYNMMSFGCVGWGLCNIRLIGMLLVDIDLCSVLCRLIDFVWVWCCWVVNWVVRVWVNGVIIWCIWCSCLFEVCRNLMFLESCGILYSWMCLWLSCLVVCCLVLVLIILCSCVIFCVVSVLVICFWVVVGLLL